MAAGNNPANSERRRWAALQLAGKRYPRGTAPDELHLDLRLSPRLVLLNLCRSPETYAEHANCRECAEILTAAGTDRAAISDAQWEAFMQRYGGGPARGDR